MSKKVQATLNDKKRKEQEERARQAESYTAMISHEMATPLGSIIFFLNFINTFLNSLEDTSKIFTDKETKLQRAIKYLALTQSQLQLMQSFCSDLLDLRSLKDGIFNLVKEVFKPSETFDLVCSIFSP